MEKDFHFFSFNFNKRMQLYSCGFMYKNIFSFAYYPKIVGYLQARSHLKLLQPKTCLAHEIIAFCKFNVMFIYLIKTFDEGLSLHFKKKLSILNYKKQIVLKKK